MYPFPPHSDPLPPPPRHCVMHNAAREYARVYRARFTRFEAIESDRVRGRAGGGGRGRVTIGQEGARVSRGTESVAAIDTIGGRRRFERALSLFAFVIRSRPYTVAIGHRSLIGSKPAD